MGCRKSGITLKKVGVHIHGCIIITPEGDEMMVDCESSRNVISNCVFHSLSPKDVGLLHKWLRRHDGSIR